MAYPHPIIAREGWPFLGIAVVAAAAVHFFLGFWWSLPFWVVAVFVLQFFRDPGREAPQDAGAVLSPADGRIVFVGKSTDPYLNREALKISVFMNVFNVHSNRSPVDGTVKKRWYHQGSFLNAALDKASIENERNALWLQTATGADVSCVQIAGLVARRIVPWIKVGDRVMSGQRVGLIRFGSRVDVYLPAGTSSQVLLGQRTVAGETIVARAGISELIEGVAQ